MKPASTEKASLRFRAGLQEAGSPPRERRDSKGGSNLCLFFQEFHARAIAAPVAVHSLAAFRILFGLLMTAAMLRLLALGWVGELFVEPRFHFAYPGFEWVRAWPSLWMHVHVAGLAGCALGIALGYRHRVCSGLFLLGFGYLELIDQTTYLNHYYLVTLLAGLLVVLPAQGAWSVDAWRNPRVRRDVVPAWTVNLLRFQIGVVYFFAGVAKLNADWLGRAQPLRIWLPTRMDLPLIGSYLDQTWVAYAASWSGAVFDLSIPFLLLFRRTRLPAFAVLVVFHVLTWRLFNIGLFPWIMMVGALMFFPAGWPLMHGWGRSRKECGKSRGPGLPVPRWQGVLLSVYVTAQVVIPLREFVYPGPSAWSYEGFNFAWKVMVAEKTGHVTFHAWDPVRRSGWRLRTSDYLTPRQAVMMAQDPHLIRIMARRLAADLEAQGHAGIEVRAEAVATLNGRPGQALVDPGVNLGGPLAEGWIVPLR